MDFLKDSIDILEYVTAIAFLKDSIDLLKDPIDVPLVLLCKYFKYHFDSNSSIDSLRDAIDSLKDSLRLEESIDFLKGSILKDSIDLLDNSTDVLKESINSLNMFVSIL